MLAQADLYWLAGLLEGEGSFTAGPPSKPNCPRITLAMIDIDIVKRAAALLGAPSVRMRHYSNNWHTIYECASSGARAVAIMRQLQPLMGSRRQAQIERAAGCYDPLARSRARSRHAWPKRGHSKLTDQQVLEIYRRAHSGESLRHIAQDMGVSYNACSDIKCGQSWAWLTGHVRNDRGSTEKQS